MKDITKFRQKVRFSKLMMKMYTEKLFCGQFTTMQKSLKNVHPFDSISKYLQFINKNIYYRITNENKKLEIT